MRTLLTMKDYIRAIFEYEFQTGKNGLTQSEFTKDIIEAEVNRLTRHRKDLDFTKAAAYVFILGQTRSRLFGFSSIDDAVEKVDSSIGDAYIFYNGDVLQVNNGKLSELEDCVAVEV